MKMHKLDKTIKKYKNSFNPSFFKDVVQSKINDNPNPTYYHKIINKWLDTRSNELKENKLLKCKANLLNEYLEDLRWLMIWTVELYEAVNRYEETKRAIINRINNKEFEVLETLKAIEDYKISINLNYEKGEYNLSIELTNYCLNKFNECVRLLEDRLFIRIYDSPITKDFKGVRGVFEGLINLKEVEILKNSINTREVLVIQKETHFVKETKVIEKSTQEVIYYPQPPSIIKNNTLPQYDNNPHPKIFKEVETYKSFETFSQMYIIDEYTDYSYLFQRLKSEELIHYIKHLDFMKWLFENSFINERVYDNFTSKGNLKSLSKSYSTQRQNNFNNLFL